MYEGDVVVQGVLEAPPSTTQCVDWRRLNEIKTLATFRRQLEEARATSWKFTWPKRIFHSLLSSLTTMVMVITGLLLLRYLLPVVLQKYRAQKKIENGSARLNQKGRVEVGFDPDMFDPEDALYNTLWYVNLPIVRTLSTYGHAITCSYSFLLI